MLYLLFWKNRLISVGKNTVITLILKRVPSCRHGNQQLPLSDLLALVQSEDGLGMVFLYQSNLDEQPFVYVCGGHEVQHV